MSPVERRVAEYDIPEYLAAPLAARALADPEALAMVRNYTCSLDGSVALLGEVLPDWGDRLTSQAPGVAAAEVF